MSRRGRNNTIGTYLSSLFCSWNKEINKIILIEPDKFIHVYQINKAEHKKRFHDMYLRYYFSKLEYVDYTDPTTLKIYLK